MRAHPVLALLLAAAPLAAADALLPFDALTLVRAAAERQQAAESLHPRLVFDHVDVLVERDAQGRPKGVERHVYVSTSHGRGVESRELVAVDGRAPTEKERRQIREEDAKRRRHRDVHAASGDPSEDDDLRAGRLPLPDLLARYDFRLAGEEAVDGRPAYVVAFSPRAGRAPKTIRDRVLDEFEGKAWIDAAELQLLRLEGRLGTKVKVAGGLALELRRVELLYEALPLGPSVWQPCREELRIDATAGLVFPFRRDVRFEFSNYRAAARGVPPSDQGP